MSEETSTSFRLTLRPRGTSQPADGEKSSGQLSGAVITFIMLGVLIVLMMIALCIWHFFRHHCAKHRTVRQPVHLDPESGGVESLRDLPSSSPPQLLLSRSPSVVLQFWREKMGDSELSYKKAVELETKLYNQALDFPKSAQPMEKPTCTAEPPQRPVKLPKIIAPSSPKMSVSPPKIPAPPSPKISPPTPVQPKESPKKPAGPDDKVGMIVVTKMF